MDRSEAAQQTEQDQKHRLARCLQTGPKVNPMGRVRHELGLGTIRASLEKTQSREDHHAILEGRRRRLFTSSSLSLRTLS
jgi:hypothetical protein